MDKHPKCYDLVVYLGKQNYQAGKEQGVHGKKSKSAYGSAGKN